MKYDLVLIFKSEKLTEIMDSCDLTDGSHKIYCKFFNISIEAKENWDITANWIKTIFTIKCTPLHKD